MRITEPMSIRARLRQYSEIEETYLISEGAKGAIIGLIEKYIKAVDKENVQHRRKILFGWLFGDENLPPALISSKAFRTREWYALQRWIGMHAIMSHDGKEKWNSREEFAEEFWWVLARSKCVFDIAHKSNPPETVSSVNRLLMSSQIVDNVQNWIDYEAGGVVSAMVQKGCSVITEKPYSEPVDIDEIVIQPVSVYEPAPQQSYIAQRTIREIDESEL